jgi:hypothetical protein
LLKKSFVIEGPQTRRAEHGWRDRNGIGDGFASPEIAICAVE